MAAEVLGVDAVGMSAAEVIRDLAADRARLLEEVLQAGELVEELRADLRIMRPREWHC